MNSKSLKIILSTIILGGISLGFGIKANASTIDDLSISDVSVNKYLPSASGMDYYDGHTYVIGDDSPYLFELDKNFNIIDKTLIKNYPVNQNNRISKSIKPDFESFDIFKYDGEPYAIFLGSGSKSTRMTGYVVNLNTKEKYNFNLNNLYNKLRKDANFPSNLSLNVEGITFANDKFVILNRGNSYKNIIFTLSSDDMMNYIKGQQANLDSIKSYPVQLPKIDGIESELSGVDYLKGEDKLILTTSVECTGDAIHDGKILGSFVGTVDMDDLEKSMNLTPNFKMITQNGEPFITKAESVTVKSIDGDDVTGMIASDNDNGTSQFFNFNLDLD